MRIALTHLRHAHTGGTERYLHQLARHLAETGHGVTIVCRRHEEAPHPAVRFAVLHDFALGGAWRMWAFARAVERHVARAQYDLVLGLGKTWSQDVLRLGGGLQRTYLELAHRDTLSRPERLMGKGWLKHRLALRIEARALAPGAFRRVIANSTFVKRDLMARYGIADDAVEVIHNGVDLSRFHPRLRATAGAKLRRALGFDDTHVVVLFLGSGYGRKGLDRVLRALPALVARHPRLRLVVAGYDSAQRAFEEEGRRLGLAEVSRFLGGRRDPETCYAAADLYVLPTRYDPFANSTLEALASGLPVITTARNGGAEVIEPGVQGDVLGAEDGAEALGAALERWFDDDRRRAASGAARTLAERHGIEEKLARTARVLEEARRAPAGASLTSRPS